MQAVLVFFAFLFSGYSPNYPLPHRPSTVTDVLKKSGNHAAELEKAIRHFEQTGDSLKIRAIYFLVGNMDIHFSVDQYWADNKKRRVAFNELQYANFSAALQAFEELKKHSGQLHQVETEYKDIDTVTAGFLISNVELAFSEWRRQDRPCSFGDFCEYILPYRVSTEPLQDWRSVYFRRFGQLGAGIPSRLADTILYRIGADIAKSFCDVYHIEQHSEARPRLGALQLLFREKGVCEDIADLSTLMARVNGIPSAVDYIPAWATASGLHYLNYMKIIPRPGRHFDASNKEGPMDTLSREPAKVIRTTWSRQPATLAMQVDTMQIPPGFMRMADYRDVTGEYWATADLQARLFGLTGESPPVAYAAVWNFKKWKTVWWGKIIGHSVFFNDMCVGAVYLPQYYLGGKLTPAGWPVVLERDKTIIELKTDPGHLRSIVLKEQPKYLAFRTGKKYTLYYWNNQWVRLDQQTATSGMMAMPFDHVPANALLLLVPEYSQGKERPFLVAADGTRQWF